MNLLSIVLFFVMSWGLGFSLTFFINRKSDVIERNVMNVGIGLGLFSVLAAIMTLLRIPLKWYLFVALSLIIPIYCFIMNKKTFSMSKFKFKKSHIYLIVVFVLFMFTFNMYAKGAFSYDLFEDGDPWKHSGIAKYIALTGSALEPFENYDVLQYIDSYPPAYDTLLSFAYQISGNLIWSVKFFNILLISLGIIFMYFLVKEFTKDKNKALFSTFALAMIPCYMSHFIWAHTLVILLIYPLLYCLIKMREDKLWSVPFTLVYAGVMVVQPTQAVKISIMIGLYILVKSILEKKILFKEIYSSIIAVVTSIVIWWGPMILKYKSVGRLLSVAKGVNPTKVLADKPFSLKFVGSADRLYSFSDFFYSKAQNMINNPVGVGVFLMLLLFVTLIFVVVKYKDMLKKQNHWVIISGVWLLFAFLGIHGERLPIQLWAFRFWMLFALTLSIFIGFGFTNLLEFCKKIKISTFVVIIVLVMGIWFTSGVDKYAVNTSNWEMTAAEYVQYGNLDSWKRISTLEPDSKVFFPCRNVKNMDISILGLDKYSCLWCEDEKDFKMSYYEKEPQALIDFVKSKDYDYLYMDANCLTEFNKNVTNFNSYLTNLSQTGIPLVHKSQGGFLWKV